MRFAEFFRRKSKTSSPKTGRLRRRTAPLHLEALEDRWLPSTIVVTDSGDALHINPFLNIDQVNALKPKPPIDLRDAIFAANNSPSPSLINFQNPFTIFHPQTPLPHLVGNGITIAGDHIRIDGFSGGNNGLVLLGNDCELDGLYITNFAGAGVVVEGTTGDKINGCEVGDGFAEDAHPNGVGVYVANSVGTTLLNDAILDNAGNGIEIHDSAGVLLDQVVATGNGFPHGGDGVLVVGQKSDAGESYTTQMLYCTFDENNGAGVHLRNSSGNQVGQASFMGYNWIGGEDVDEPTEGNLGDGVLIESTPGSQSVNNAVTYNFIGGNHGNGVTLTGTGTAFNQVVKSFIGVTAVFDPDDPTHPILKQLGNHGDGVAVLGAAHDNQVGGAGLFKLVPTTEAANVGLGNLIVYNGENGVRLAGPGVTQNDVQGNAIGADFTGKKAWANDDDGVLIEAGAAKNLVGGARQVQTKDGEGNQISGAQQAGVHVRGAGTNANRIEGNFIGTDDTGTAGVSNAIGVVIEAGAANNSVGSALIGGLTRGNVISANRQYGVLIAGPGTTGNVVRANDIGTDLTGEQPLGNTGDGVFLTGGASGNTVGGVVLGAPFPFLPGNVISANRGNGVEIAGQGTTNNHVQGNRIGTDAAGMVARANSFNGVLIDSGAAMNFVGDSTPAGGNLISGNDLAGVVVSADHNYVLRNRIGTKGDGLVALPNLQDGVDLFGSNNGVAWNLISGNGHKENTGDVGNGLVIEGSNNTILANQIGTDATGSGAVGNTKDGVLIDVLFGPGGNLVGAPFAGAGNLISGNGYNGIEITGPVSASNQIEGNRIGTDAAGQSAVPNHRNGILVDNTTGFTIGGQSAAAGNQISGNRWDGVLITGLQSNGLVLRGNRIGTDAAGKGPVPNLGNGVHLDLGAGNTLVGGTGPADGNLISSNALDGVLITGYYTDGNQIQGNRIGTDVGGQYAVPNGQNGVEVSLAGGNFIGGGAAGAGNLISGNKHDGVKLAGAYSNLVAGNLIGTNLTGVTARPNGGDGVEILGGAVGNTVGGLPMSATTPGNVISGNTGSGVVISDAGTHDNHVQGNLIGTRKSGVTALGNQGDGVDVLNGAANNDIGGHQAGAGNVIAGNAGDGVHIFGGGTSNNHVLGNWIGTDTTGLKSLGNTGHGVWIALGAHDNNVGGLAAGAGNVIAFNGKAGVAVGDFIMDAASIHNAILSNRIYGNARLGIDLGGDGVTPNSPGGPHVGPNQFQNTPVIQSATAGGASTTVVMTLNSSPGATFLIQIFANASPDPSGYGQGKTLLATYTVTTDAAGNIVSVIGNNAQVINNQLVVTLPQNLAGQYLTATATSSWGDTSEFGPDVLVR